MGADRSQAVAGYDGAGPRILGTFSARWGTPIEVNFLSGIVATIVMLLAFNLSGGDSEKYFNAVLNVVLLVTTISYIVIIGVIFYALGRPTREQPPDEPNIPSKPAAIFDQ